MLRDLMPRVKVKVTSNDLQTAVRALPNLLKYWWCWLTDKGIIANIPGELNEDPVITFDQYFFSMFNFSIRFLIVYSALNCLRQQLTARIQRRNWPLLKYKTWKIKNSNQNKLITREYYINIILVFISNRCL